MATFDAADEFGDFHDYLSESESEDIPDGDGPIWGYLFEPKYTAAELALLRAEREVKQLAIRTTTRGRYVIPRAGLDWWCSAINALYRNRDCIFMLQ